MIRSTAAEILQTLTHAKAHALTVQELLVGRDTHPLVDEGISDPFAYFVALESRRILDQLAALADHVENALLDGHGIHD